MGDDLQLTKIKVVASSITKKLEGLEQIREAWSWDDDDPGFARSRMQIGLSIEYATQTSEEVVTMTEQLLNNPPAYNNNPDERRQRQAEVLVLTSLLSDYAKDLESKIEALTEQINDTLDTRVDEAASRAAQIYGETCDIKGMAQRLYEGEATQ